MVLVGVGALPEHRGMNAFFTELGREVLARWKRENFSLAAFPEIARAALEERPPAVHVDLAGLVRDFLLEDEQPFQTSSGFGQPELVVFDDPRFYIQLLFWLDGTTQIHQHEFFRGVSRDGGVEPAFGIRLREHAGGYGALSRGRSVAGAHGTPRDRQHRAIVSGGGCIHSLFHLETPSLTVVVRTHSDPGTGRNSPTCRRTSRWIRSSPTRSRRAARNSSTCSSARAIRLRRARARDGRRVGFRARVFHFAKRPRASAQPRRMGRDARDILREARGAGDVVEPTLDEIVWRDTLVGLRSSVEEVEHRFFLALLLNVRSRAELLTFVARRFAGDPVETVLRWVEELMVESEAGVWMLDVEIDDEPEIFLAALRAILESEEIPGELAEFGAALAARACGPWFPNRA